MPEIQVTLLFNAVVLILITDNNPIVKTSIGRNVPFRPLGLHGVLVYTVIQQSTSPPTYDMQYNLMTLQ